MPTCPICLGEKTVELFIEPEPEDRILAALGEVDPVIELVGCVACEETGVVSEELLVELEAVQRAEIDQAIARARDLGLLRPVRTRDMPGEGGP